MRSSGSLYGPVRPLLRPRLQLHPLPRRRDGGGGGPDRPGVRAGVVPPSGATPRTRRPSRPGCSASCATWSAARLRREAALQRLAAVGGDYLRRPGARPAAGRDRHAAGKPRRAWCEPCPACRTGRADLLGLKYAAGLNNRQIAGPLGLSEQNVGVILYRAIGRLRQLMLGRRPVRFRKTCQIREGGGGAGGTGEGGEE